MLSSFQPLLDQALRSGQHNAFHDLRNLSQQIKKTRAPNAPKCSHVTHFCETTYFNSLVDVSWVPVPVWTVERGMGWSAECEDSEGSENSGVLSGECRVKGVSWGMWSANCRV